MLIKLYQFFVFISQIQCVKPPSVETKSILLDDDLAKVTGGPPALCRYLFACLFYLMGRGTSS